MKMKEYRPKSKGQWAITQQQLAQGKIPMLDLQFGGECNCRCVYCDTTMYNAPNNLDMEVIKKIVESGKLSWIFICGLGEPTARGEGNLDNREKFKYLLGLAHKNGVKVSAFSNIVDMDKEIFDHIDNETLNILHKLDSFNADRVEKVFGMEKTFGKDSGLWAKKQIENVEILREIASGKHAIDTNIAASLVLTNTNMDEAERLIDHCLDNGIFPMYGELENSGKCVGSNFLELNPTRDEVKRVQDIFRDRGISNYQTPICPSQFASVHVNNNNQATLAYGTGLSCTWCTLADNNCGKKFWLGDIREKSYEEICERIWQIRFETYPGLKKRALAEDLPIIGGCGGNQNEVLETHLDVIEKAAKNKGIELEQ